MSRLPRPLMLTLAFIVLAAAALIFEVLRAGGVFRGLSYTFGGNCRPITLGGASAGIRIDRERGLAYLSQLARDREGKVLNGTVMLLDLNTAEPSPRAAMSYDPPAFRPGALSLLKEPEKPARLFVLSTSADGGHGVEIADRDVNGAFVPRETVRDAAFSGPKAIAATGARQFYVVNDTVRSAWRERLDLLVSSGGGTLVYYDGSKSRVLVNDLDGPAGLALSTDGSRLYVAETLGRALRIYRRDAATGALTLESKVALDSPPASVDVDEDGVIWMAAHPRLLRYFAHSRNPRVRAPTQVLRFDPRQRDANATQVFTDDGSQLAGGSVAAHWHDEFLIGARFDEKVLMCRPVP